MDPQQKAEYDRIMNTPTDPNAPAEGAAQEPTQNTASPSEAPGQPNNEALIAPQPADQPQESTNEGSSGPWQSSGIPSAPAPEPTTNDTYQQESYPQEASSGLKIGYIIGGAIFIVLYAVIWLKLLGFF